MVSSRGSSTPGIQHQSALLADWVFSDSVRWISISELQLMLWVPAWPPSLLYGQNQSGHCVRSSGPMPKLSATSSSGYLLFAVLVQYWLLSGGHQQAMQKPLNFLSIITSLSLAFTPGLLVSNRSILCLPYCDQQDKPWANYSISQRLSTSVLQVFFNMQYLTV